MSIATWVVAMGRLAHRLWGFLTGTLLSRSTHKAALLEQCLQHHRELEELRKELQLEHKAKLRSERRKHSPIKVLLKAARREKNRLFCGQ